DEPRRAGRGQPRQDRPHGAVRPVPLPGRRARRRGRDVRGSRSSGRHRRGRRGGAHRALAGEAGDRVSSTATRPERLAPGYADVTIERDVDCPLPDGVVLRADVYRPATEVSLPVLLMRLPYNKTTGG